MIPAGSYTARAASEDDVCFGQSSNGNDQLAVPFTITAGDQAGQSITWIATFTEKTTSRVIEALQACGWSGNTNNLAEGISSNEVELVVQMEPDNKDGTLRPRVAFVNKPGARRFKFTKPLDKGGLSALGQRVKAHMLSSGIEAPVRSARGNDSDIPF